MAEQQLPVKVGDTVFERHVYRSPQGDGQIDFEYRVVGGELEMKQTHVGAENRPSHDFQVIPDVVRTERQQTGTTPELADVVKYVETPPGSGNFQRVIVQETINVPVYGDVQVTDKHPYKARFFGL